MQAKLNKKQQLIFFIPQTPEENQFAHQLSQILTPLEPIHFSGSCQSSPQTLKVYFNHNGRPLTTSERFTTKGIYTQGTQIELVSTSRESKKALSYLIQICQLNTLGLIYLRTEKLKDQTCLVFTGKICSLCSSSMVTGCNHMKAVCNTCAKNCSHIWLTGHILQRKPPHDTQPMLFCQFCGRHPSAFEPRIRKTPNYLPIS